MKIIDKIIWSDEIVSIVEANNLSPDNRAYTPEANDRIAPMRVSSKSSMKVIQKEVENGTPLSVSMNVLAASSAKNGKVVRAKNSLEPLIITDSEKVKPELLKSFKRI